MGSLKYWDTNDNEWKYVLGVQGQPEPSGESVVNVMDYGAVADGSTDNKSALESAFASAVNGNIVHFPAGEYFISDEVTVPAGVIVRGVGVKSVIKFSHNSNAFRLLSDTTVESMKFIGSYAGDTTLSLQRAIAAYPSVDDGTQWLSNVTIRNITAENCGVHGVRLRFVRGFVIDNSEFYGWGQAGVFLSNSYYGVVNNSRFYGDNTNPFGNSYGVIASTSGVAYDETSNPGSRWIDIVGNTVRDVAWVGINTHGGRGIRIRGNTILGCYTGISSVVVSPTHQTPPEALIVSDNVIDGGNLSTKRYGIYISSDGTAPTDAIVTGNRVRRHGSFLHEDWGGIVLYRAPMTLVANNIITRCFRNGISAIESGGSTINGNLIVDVCSDNANHSPAAIYLANDGSTVTWYHLVGNAIRRGNLSATAINKKGIESLNLNTIRWTQHGNDWSEAELAYDEFPIGETLIGHTSGNATRVGFYGATPITRRSISGSKGGNTALTNLLNALHEIGIINNNTS